jgi:hypothetical protein
MQQDEACKEADKWTKQQEEQWYLIWGTDKWRNLR